MGVGVVPPRRRRLVTRGFGPGRGGCRRQSETWPSRERRVRRRARVRAGEAEGVPRGGRDGERDETSRV